MSKLEEKLVELGYSTEKIVFKEWYKGLIVITTMYDKILDYRIDTRVIGCIKSQLDIDKIQQALNTLQQDLEELKLCEQQN